MKKSSIKLSKPDHNSMVVTIRGMKRVITPVTTSREVYNWILTNPKNEVAWLQRTENCRLRFNMSNEFLAKVCHWLCSRPKIQTVQKYVFFKVMLNCYPGKQTLWNKGTKNHPVCYVCDNEFENMEHLFGFSVKLNSELKKCGIEQISDVLDEPIEDHKVEIVWIILSGSWTENMEDTFFKMKWLYNKVFM